MSGSWAKLAYTQIYSLDTLWFCFPRFLFTVILAWATSLHSLWIYLISTYSVPSVCRSGQTQSSLQSPHSPGTNSFCQPFKETISCFHVIYILNCLQWCSQVKRYPYSQPRSMWFPLSMFLLYPPPSPLTFYLYFFFWGTYYPPNTEELCISISSSLLNQMVFMVITESDLSVWFYYQALTRELKKNLRWL